MCITQAVFCRAIPRWVWGKAKSWNARNTRCLLKVSLDKHVPERQAIQDFNEARGNGVAVVPAAVWTICTLSALCSRHITTPASLLTFSQTGCCSPPEPTVSEHWMQKVGLYIGWQWRNFVPYLCQLVFAAILWVKLSEMFVTLLSLKYAFSVG